MKRFSFILGFALFVASVSFAGTSTQTPAGGAVVYNEAATQHLHQQLGQTQQVKLYLGGAEHTLSAPETQELLTLLQGAVSAETLCPPEDCFYLNLYGADGAWLMSLPVQNTPKGMVLLYLGLQGEDACAALQQWWVRVTERLSPGLVPSEQVKSAR